MLRMYGKYWWSFLIRGVLATLFGLIAIVVPGITMGALAILLAIFLIADGVFSFVASFKGRELSPRWGFLLVEGIAGIGLGLLTIVWPGLTVLAIVLIIGFWAMVTGVLEILAAIKLRDEIEGEWHIPGDWSGTFLMVRARKAKAEEERKVSEEIGTR